eukprot:2120760-Alexandrium_andersonii.AAC.1
MGQRAEALGLGMGSFGPLRRRGKIVYLSSGAADEPAPMPLEPVSGDATSAISGVAPLGAGSSDGPDTQLVDPR